MGFGFGWVEAQAPNAGGLLLLTGSDSWKVRRSHIGEVGRVGQDLGGGEGAVTGVRGSEQLGGGVLWLTGPQGVSTQCQWLTCRGQGTGW